MSSEMKVWAAMPCLYSTGVKHTALFIQYWGKTHSLLHAGQVSHKPLRVEKAAERKWLITPLKAPNTQSHGELCYQDGLF